ncbi:hypothetical protein WB66_17525 [bacteria symbiont BFo1 of Frankliniella occidentalis]|jgi:hypothetical protein|nr:hypothetical protein WB66_17525 [bacteria symbiont BFo1 of Frankliniella occidentalis]KYP88749.1 hypothetical protein WB91_16355 [bacteria symbiont BFo1 of Frankliniella occidentalis]PIJ59876.1 hypothetical protein BOM23_02400 [Erwinia sp. OLMDLW33]
MLKERTCFATCFQKKRHKTRDNPATGNAVLRAVPHAVHCIINSAAKKRYTVRHVWLTDAE